MKKLLLIYGLTLIISCKKESPDNSLPSNALSTKLKSHSLSFDKDLKSVNGIKQQYQAVNSKLEARELDSLRLEYECDERSGTVTYFSENGKLKAVRHFQADSHFSATDHYFLNDGKPYFIFQEETVWSFDGGTPEDPITKDEVREKRYYIVQGKAIQCLEKKYTLKSNSKENPKSENIPNNEMKNCSVADLQKNFDRLLEVRSKKEHIKCL